MKHAPQFLGRLYVMKTNKVFLLDRFHSVVAFSSHSKGDKINPRSRKYMISCKGETLRPAEGVSWGIFFLSELGIRLCGDGLAENKWFGDLN
ncbi:hypothetical protein OPV22_016690 [Ensete ventricosum]|uniref:Uncharacterized protein n=1 Tax=Ensete ventricosum TaxID=4639 RepID=A0AAV8QS61_ENSVE|nr:hypothetical protein OPV22_016690 [Ensete ventricosum]